MVSQKPTGQTTPTVYVAGGGTGGHLYPALAIADALRRRLPDVRFVFFATERAIDGRIVGQTGRELVRQTLPPLRRAPWHWPRMFSGYRRSRHVCRARLAEDNVVLVIGTGGYASVPAVFEARRVRVPTVLLNPDALPGKANYLLAPKADIVFAQWEETVKHFQRGVNVRVCGCAIRPEFVKASREAAIQRFGLDSQRKTLLVTGASQGARTLNQALLANLDYIESRSDWQVLHLTGEQDFEEVAKAYAGSSIHACVLRFTDHMAEALAAADLVLSRAGASTLAEITAAGRASILMPYPHDKNMHQLANARCLERRSATCIVHDAIDPVVNGPVLRRSLEALMSNDDKRAATAVAARHMGRAGAAEDTADQIMTLVTPRAAGLPGEFMEVLCRSAR
ncbi:MAG: UDP-N-acetylglucosamine--N-acetylmuramyl-(pentapeptide) pyrophosphoryl-undecaprenol N-acetylglucosamine transferase [Planctomycetota bacterium]|jgi:UDP-N-acetylglucosamine--N-acetylmuramyl-(pentapeptide) pyrophosphoryl-undecaprenol N-acetylglucosamine transferase